MPREFTDPFEKSMISLLPLKYQKALLLIELGYGLSDAIKDSVAAYAHPDTIEEMPEEKIDEFFKYLESVATNLNEFIEQLLAEVEK